MVLAGILSYNIIYVVKPKICQAYKQKCPVQNYFVDMDYLIFLTTDL